jgi:hypothetical protein
MTNYKARDNKLPIEYPFREAASIYIRRLAVFSAVILANILLLGLVVVSTLSPAVELLILYTLMLTIVAIPLIKGERIFHRFVLANPPNTIEESSSDNMRLDGEEVINPKSTPSHLAITPDVYNPTPARALLVREYDIIRLSAYKRLAQRGEA